MSLEKTLQDHNDEIQSLVDEFKKSLETMAIHARARVMSILMTRLKTEDGKIAQTSENAKILRDIPREFENAMDELGYSELVQSFVSQFPDQYKWFHEILEEMLPDSEIRERIVKATQLTSQDIQFLSQQNVATTDALENVVEVQANALKSRALLSIGGLTPKALSDMLMSRLDVVPNQAATLAATSISTFYRTISSLSYQNAEKQKGISIRYRYVGPPSGDPVERPFCVRLMESSEAGVTYTRDQIDEMNNGQIPDVFTTCGGYNCRHSWVIAEMKDSHGNVVKA